jgi:hypothetical protein
LLVDTKKALEYAIHNQRDRRNLTDADIFRLVGLLDKREKREEAQARPSPDIPTS